MKKLQGMRKEIVRKAEIYSQGGHRNRVTAIGETVLKLLEDLHNKQAEQELKGHKLLDGTLFWLIEEARVKDTDGKKGYRYTIAYFVKCDEAKYTEDEIKKEIQETYELMKQETDEMYSEIAEEEDAEE